MTVRGTSHLAMPLPRVCAAAFLAAVMPAWPLDAQLMRPGQAGGRLPRTGHLIQVPVLRAVRCWGLSEWRPAGVGVGGCAPSMQVSVRMRHLVLCFVCVWPCFFRVHVTSDFVFRQDSAAGLARLRNMCCRTCQSVQRPDMFLGASPIHLIDLGNWSNCLRSTASSVSLIPQLTDSPST